MGGRQAGKQEELELESGLEALASCPYWGWHSIDGGPGQPGAKAGPGCQDPTSIMGREKVDSAASCLDFLLPFL